MKLALWRALALSGAVLAGLSLLAIVYLTLSPQPSKLTDAQIAKDLGCGRLTADVRATDVYCTFPDIYRQHVSSGNVIGQPMPPGSRTFYLTFVDSTTKKVVARTNLKIASNNGVVCQPGACNTNAKEWSGQTDGNGTIKLDSDYIQLVMTAEVAGYKQTALAPRAGQHVYIVSLQKP